MNPVEIEQAITDLAEHPFDAANFPYTFLEALGNKDTTIKRLRAGASNKSDLGGVLQTSNIHIVATSDLYNINRVKLENLIHRVFDPARLDIEIKDRFGKPVMPREWFLVPVFVIDEAVEAVEARKPPLNAEQVSGMIKSHLEGAAGTAPFPKDKEQAIKRVFKTVSPWDDVKRAGRASLPKGQAVQHFDKLLDVCAGIGPWIIPVGELEGFCPSIDGGHGPGFVETVLEERNVETDTELADAREFVADILTRARQGSNDGITARTGDASGTT